MVEEPKEETSTVKEEVKKFGCSPHYPKDMTLGYWVLCYQSFQIKNCLIVLIQMSSYTWNNVKCHLDATRQFYWCILSSTYFGYIRPSSEALDV